MDEQRLPRRFRRALKPIRRIQWRYQRDRHGGPRWRLCAVGIADYDRRQTLGVMVAGVPSVGIACVGGPGPGPVVRSAPHRNERAGPRARYRGGPRAVRGRAPRRDRGDLAKLTSRRGPRSGSPRRLALQRAWSLVTGRVLSFVAVDATRGAEAC